MHIYLLFAVPWKVTATALQQHRHQRAKTFHTPLSLDISVINFYKCQQVAWKRCSFDRGWRSTMSVSETIRIHSMTWEDEIDRIDVDLISRRIVNTRISNLFKYRYLRWKREKIWYNHKIVYKFLYFMKKVICDMYFVINNLNN